MALGLKGASGAHKTDDAGYLAEMTDLVARLNAALEGRYRIERQIGEGGTATVYLGDDLRHERKVALKILKPELAAVVGAERFLAEIKTTANLQHPQILPLFDSGAADSFLFYVMPYVDGESLREKLDREHQLPVDDAVRIATDVAEALDYAHSRGVIHRDIKPANILLQAGKPVISDFGIALALGVAGGGRLTETGVTLGTPHYMSPEQATGDVGVSAATDIYALGCVLYELLVGEPPYTGSTPQAILGKIIAGELASATKLRASVPDNVDATIRKALEQVPADRFTGAQEFAKALGDSGFRHGEAVTAGMAAGRGQRTPLAMGFAALALLFALGLGWSLSRPEPNVPTSSIVRFTVPLPAGETLGLNLCCSPISLSPDGEWLAFVTQEGALYRRRIGQLEAEPVPGGEGARSPFFSPDGQWLAFYVPASGRLVRVPMGGGPPVPIAEISGSPWGASWGDDGSIVFVDQIGGVAYTVASTGGAPVAVTDPGGVGYSFPWMLPGGGAALMTTRGSLSERRTVVVDLESGALDTLGLATRVEYASGHLLFSTADRSLIAQPFDPVARRTIGPALTILDDLAVGGGTAAQGGVFWPSTQGALAYATGVGESRTLLIRAGDVATPLQLGVEGVVEDLAYSPDGRRIAMRINGLGDSQDIWIFDRDQGVLDRLTEEGSINMIPVWTPDGQRIAFMSHRDDDPGGSIYWQAADGSGPAEPLLATELREFPGSWSLDGQTLAFDAVREGNRDIGLFTLGDSAPRWIVESEFNESQPRISPDGRWLAYSSNRSGRQEVYVQALDGVGGRVTVSVDGGRSPRWDPQGGVLYYAATGNSTSGQIVGATVVTDPGIRVTSRDALFTAAATSAGGLPFASFDVGPYGEEFVYLGSDTSEGADLFWILNWPEIVREIRTLQ